MTQHVSATIFLPDENATTELGSELAPRLESGDVVLLKGSVGAGKSHLARAIIQTRLGYPEDVPSPTYTLIQTYTEPSAEIFHADLYRLSDTSELVELGLQDAFENAICLVEWAERLGKEDIPKGALELTLETQGEGRLATISSSAPSWQKAVHAFTRTQFLIGSGWVGARKTSVAGDLSSRTYQRLKLGAHSAILMDAGVDVASTQQFVGVSEWLNTNGYSAPKTLAHDPNNAMILLDDFGDEPLSKRHDVEEQMSLCLIFLADIRQKATPALPCPSSAELAEMTELASHYPGADFNALKRFRAHLSGCIEKVMSGVQPTVSLRDFHADNIMWLAERDGIARLGLLDFQDAFLTHPVYDLVSLLTDARREVSSKSRQALILEYAKVTGDDLVDLQEAFAVFSVQRNLRILGIFSRAALEHGKTHHVPNLPRVYGYLIEALGHAAFKDVANDLLIGLPKPEKALLDRLAA